MVFSYFGPGNLPSHSLAVFTAIVYRKIHSYCIHIISSVIWNAYVSFHLLCNI
uniref:Uncharacterized protein n=1 Tax=Anguilla anguilla TaxID=7936 RepID=A0A0E9UTR4_ANGAN